MVTRQASRDRAVDALDEARDVYGGPIRVLGFELRTELFAGILGGNALPFQRQRSGLKIADEIAFGSDHRTVAGRAVVRQNVLHVQRSELVENGDPAWRRSAVIGDSGHHLVLYKIARDQRAIGFHESKLVALRVTLAEPQQPRRDAAS